jgi:ABC-type sugar transport system ATPase subunit
MMNYVVELKDITKFIYGDDGRAIRNTDVTILKNVNFTLKKGEVHALIGANGAGKSTLMKVLGGIIPPERGKILLDGKPVVLHNPKLAREKGISFIHQELNLCTNLDVAHNLFLGREPKKNGLIDKKRIYYNSKELIKSIGMEIDVYRPIGEFSTSVQQIIEILKALSFESKIVIMDEPTASLSHNETAILFNLIKDLKNRGISIIYISHRFEEICTIADRGTILKDGMVAGSFDIADFDYDKIVTMMIGNAIKQVDIKVEEVSTIPILEVKGIRLKKNWTNTITMNIHKGEIVGLAGLVGSGRTELAKSIFTGKGYLEGEIFFEGKKIHGTNTYKSIKQGIGYLSENRKEEGLILPMTIRRNLTLASLHQMFPHGWIKKQREISCSREMIEKLSIVSWSDKQTVNTLSGGNQQRIVFGKWLNAKPKLLLLDEPTRGVDVNAKNEIYNIIQDSARSGITILLISSELQELINMSNRIYTIKNGGIVGEITNRNEMTQEKILKMIL